MECKLTRPQAELLLANHAGMGHQLWRELTQVVFLDLNMRSQGQLCQLLQQMRSGKLTDAAWQSLEDRVLRTEKTGKPDARLSQPPFSAATNRCIVHRHALRVPLAYSLALKDSIEQEQIFFVLHACDEVPPSDEHRSREICQHRRPRFSLGTVHDANVAWQQREHGAGHLHRSFAPRVLAVVECFRRRLEEEGSSSLRCWQERALTAVWQQPRRCDGPQNKGCRHVLEHIQVARTTIRGPLVRLSGREYYFDHFYLCSIHQAKAHAVLAVVKAQSHADIQRQHPRKASSLTRIGYLQHLPSHISCKPPRMTPEVHWLAVYVMLSRARTLDGILLLRNAEKEQLECGPPEYLVQETERLLKLERQCAAEVEKQLRQIKHLPREIIDMFAPQIAELQRERHHRCMSAAGGACAAAGAPGRRYRGKQPRRRDADKEHAPNANLDTGGSDADEEAEPHASLGAGAGDHTGHMCRQICE